MKKECGDCHETQGYVVSHTKSHSKYECTLGCHVNTAAGPKCSVQWARWMLCAACTYVQDQRQP